MYTFKNGTQVKNKTSELTIDEFGRIIKNYNDYKKMDIDKHIETLLICGIDKETLIDLKYSEVKSFFASIETETFELKRSIFIDGNEYKFLDAEEDLLEWEPTARELSLLINYISKDSNFFLYTVALFYKDIRLTNNEHYDKAHIEYKMKLFNQGKASDYLQLVALIGRVIGNDLVTDNDLKNKEEIMNEINKFNSAK